MTDQPDSQADEQPPEEEAPRWPAVVGVVLIIGFSWAGIEIFFLQGVPVATLQHPALISDQGAYFEVEKSGREHLVRAWTYIPEGDQGERLRKASGKLEMSVLDPDGEVVASYADEKEQKKARYIRFVPKSKGTYSVRVGRVTGDGPPGVQARVFAGNNQILLPMLSKLLGKDTASGGAAK